MPHANHRGLGHRRMRNHRVLEIDRADPLAAGFNHVLRAVGDVHVAVGVDGGDVAGGKPAVGRHLVAALALEITLGDPWTFDHDVTEGDAVVRQFFAVTVDDLELHAVHHTALL